MGRNTHSYDTTQDRQFAKQYSIVKAKERKAKRVKLELRVKELEGLLSTDSQEIAKEYYDCKQELERIYTYITEGIIMRSKTDWYEHGEKSTKYFLNLEKRNKAKSHIRKIITDDLRETSYPTVIMSNLKTFYGTLYKSRNHKTESECFSYLDSIDTPNLSEDEKNLCEGKLTVKKCWDALNSMGANKSPRNDGLSKEFYICFFKEIHMYLIQALNHSFSNEQLSNSQRQAMITLIEKKRQR